MARKKRSRAGVPSTSKTILDVFTERDLEHWSSRSVVAQRYSDYVYYDLERQRAQHFDGLIDALRSSTPAVVDLSRWARITDYRWSLEPLSPAGSLKNIGGRFNIGTDLDRARGQHFPALYIADSTDTGFREFFLGPPDDKKMALTMAELALRHESSFTAFALRGRVDHILDLRTEEPLKSFAKIISKFTLTEATRRFALKNGLRSRSLVKTAKMLHEKLLIGPEAWRTEPQLFGIPAPSQVFGRFARDAGFEAILFPSQRGGGMNLAVFVENFRNSSSHIEVVGASPDGARFLTLDKESPQQLDWAPFFSPTSGGISR